MNKVILIGNTTKQPELRHTQSNVPVASFTIACKRKFKNTNGEYETDFFQCVAWRKLAETISKYVDKGHKIAVIGRIENSSYDTAEGKRYKTEIIVDEIEFLESKKKEEKTSNEGQYQSHQPKEDNFFNKNSAIDITDDDLPF